MSWRFWESKETRIAREAAAWRAEMEDPGTPQQVEHFEAWLRADPAHLRAYREMDTLSVAGQRLQPETVVANTASRRLYFAPALSLLLVSIALVVGALVLGNSTTPAFASVKNDGNSVRAVRLTDGTSILLDSGTRLEVGLSDRKRVVRLLSGRIRLAVGGTSVSPLVVETADGAIVADAGLLDVSFVNGRIGVRLWRGSARAAAVSAGSEATAMNLPLGSSVALHDGKAMPQSMAENDALWPLARVAFDDAPLASVLARADRVPGPRVVADDGIGALRITAVLDLRDKAALARKLAAALDLQVVERDGALVLTR